MTKEIAIPTGATTLADLMRMGATVTFGSGRRMHGDLRSRYIDVANEFGGLGVWDLDSTNGADDAVSDLVHDAAKSGYGLHGGELPHPDDQDETEGDEHVG